MCITCHDATRNFWHNTTIQFITGKEIFEIEATYTTYKQIKLKLSKSKNNKRKLAGTERIEEKYKFESTVQFYSYLWPSHLWYSLLVNC